MPAVSLELMNLRIRRFPIPGTPIILLLFLMSMPPCGPCKSGSAVSLQASFPIGGGLSPGIKVRVGVGNATPPPLILIKAGNGKLAL